MSPFFISEIKRTNRCKDCKADAIEGYSVCLKHLEEAKTRWANWSVERRAAGKCCYCNNKSFNGWLRCRKHTKINREKCKVWMAANGKRLWEERKAATLATGLCHKCKARNPVIPGTFRCEECKRREHGKHSG